MFRKFKGLMVTKLLSLIDKLPNFRIKMIPIMIILNLLTKKIRKRKKVRSWARDKTKDPEIQLKYSTRNLDSCKKLEQSQ